MRAECGAARGAVGGCARGCGLRALGGLRAGGCARCAPARLRCATAHPRAPLLEPQASARLPRCPPCARPARPPLHLRPRPCTPAAALRPPLRACAPFPARAFPGSRCFAFNFLFSVRSGVPDDFGGPSRPAKGGAPLRGKSPTAHQKGPKMVPKRSKMIKNCIKWCQNGFKMVSKMVQNGRKWSQKLYKIAPKWSKKCPKMVPKLYKMV